MAWKPDATGVLHWVDDPNADLSGMTMAVSGRSADDRWEDPENSDQGGGEKKPKDEGDNGNNDNGDNGDSGNNGNNGGGDNGNNQGGGDNNNSNGSDNGNDQGGDNSGGNGSSGNQDSGGSNSGSNNFGVAQSQQARDNWEQTQQQDFQNRQDAFNSGWNSDFSGRSQQINQDSSTANPNNFGSDVQLDPINDPNSEIHQAFQWYQQHGITLLGNDNTDTGRASTPTATAPPVNPYQYSGATTPTTSNGSLISSAPSTPLPPSTSSEIAVPPPESYQPFDPNTAVGQQGVQAAAHTLPDVPPPPPQDLSAINMVPPLPAEAFNGGTAQTAATAAATATAAAGGTPQDVAQAAVLATRMLALDNQTLDQQSSWTRQIFKSTYGPNADQEWVKQHNAELQRNKGLYGSTEPTAGTAPVAKAPPGTPVAPNRTIGAVRPPGPDETAMYGSTPVARPQPQPSPTRPASPAAPVATGPAGPVAATSEPTSFPALSPSVVNATTDVNRSLINNAVQNSAPAPIPGLSPSVVNATTSTTNSLINNALQPAPADNTAPGTTAHPLAVPGVKIDPTVPGVEFYPDGTARNEKDGSIIGTYDANNPPPGLIPAGSEAGIAPEARTLRGSGVYNTSAVGQTGAENLGETTSIPAAPKPGVQSGSPGQDVLPGDVTPVADRVQTALNSARPIDTLAELSSKPGADTHADAINITNGIGAMLRGDPAGAWAEPYLNDVARLAWAREERGNGRASDPRQAPDDYIEHWKDAFFGSDHSVPMVKELDQQMIDYAVDRTPPNKPFDWKQAFGPTGENGLISRQSTSVDCGPNAFATILRSRGYNADPAQTFAYAKQTGYHNGREFTGPQNMARMLHEEAGLDAKDSPIDWKTVDSELDAGRPVLLSSPGHYWVVAARRDGANGPEYYAGQTASVVSNPSWSTRGQFRYGGAVTDMITAKGDVDPNSRAVKQMNLPVPATSSGGTRQDLSPSERMNTQIRAMSQREQPANEPPSGGSVSTGPTEGHTDLNRPLRGTPDQIQNGTTGRTELLQGSTDEGSPQPLGATAAGGPPTDQANLKPTFSVDDTINMRDRILHEAPQIQLTPDMNVDDRMRAIAPTMDWLQKEYNVPADVLAGMMYNESRVGEADAPASRANNLLSIQYMPSDSQATGLAPGQNRWAAYPTVNAGIARFLGMYAHPENGHQKFWANRADSNNFIQGLKDEHYVVSEPGAGNDVGSWERGVREGMKRYHQAIGR